MNLTLSFMPVIWRYLLSEYFKMLGLTTTASLAILLTTRLDEIAHFAAIGAAGDKILLFAFLQIPFVLPLILPLSCLVSSSLLTYRLTHTHEMTALRAAGLSLFQILKPLVLITCFIALLNFWFCSEISSLSHYRANQLKKELRAINPLLLLNAKHMLKQRGLLFKALGSINTAQVIENVVIATPNNKSQRTDLFLSKELKISEDQLKATELTLLFSQQGENAQGFDHLMIENAKEATTLTHDFQKMVQSKVAKVGHDQLPMALLLSRIEEEKRMLFQLQPSSYEAKTVKKRVARAYSEIARRFSLGLAIISLTLLGFSSHLSVQRQRRSSKLLACLIFTALFFIAYFTAKAIEHHPFLATTTYVAPHLLIIALSILFLRRISQGVE